ncbi:hypothetical protein GIB67_033584 [Kingdonia uniflora]|uniref:KIB1-4 beta-propeller domain-containing protein n=1 Tax=Kingdonia uniflora TaxID=39325 RepID=A0A7J7L2L7_9MAGN|nr:hypothetical protein GIB67_033584 [Kingdonia uniflora]
MEPHSPLIKIELDKQPPRVFAMSNWPELPPELIGLVVKRLLGYHDLSDYFSFRGVCHSWRFVATEKQNYVGIRLQSQTTFGDQYPEKSSFTSEVVREIFILISGELHLIIRYVFHDEDWEDGEPENNSVTLGACFFEIYKMDICTRQWEELDGSSEHALFLGTNCSFSLSVAEYPELKGNCVYFTDDDVDTWDCEAGRFTGIYNFEDQTVEFIDLGLDMHSTFSPPLWISPNLC